MIVILTILLYFASLLLISRWSARRATNEVFFRGERRSPWRMVAFGMIGASISGVTFVSVPGMVLTSGMSYLQLCLGFILGYLAVAFVLLPVYYRLSLTSIYAYLGSRLGERSYRTGAGFFLLSKMVGTAVKFYVACIIVQQFVMDALGVPFALTVVGMVLLIWLYTHRGGVRTLVFTDSLQTLCLFASLLIIIYMVMRQSGLSLSEAVGAIAGDERSRIFVLDDWVSRQNFWKQLLSGAFIVVVMTGLDQDMMQKNLTCRTLREAQKNMCSYGVCFLPVNMLFLALGILLARHFEAMGVALPGKGDELLPMFVQTSGSSFVLVLFTLGIVAASFADQGGQLLVAHRCHLHHCELHLWPAAGTLCLRTLHPLAGARPPGALCVPGSTSVVLCPRPSLSASLCLSFRLRAAAVQRTAHLRGSLGASAVGSLRAYYSTTYGKYTLQIGS